MTLSKYCSFFYSLFFLLNVVGPTVALLSSSEKVLTVVILVENETENETEDLKDLNEFDLDKTVFQNMNPTLNRHSLFLVFFNSSLGDVHLENTSPPPEVV